MNLSYFKDSQTETLLLNSNSFNKNSNFYNTNFDSNKLENNLYTTLFPLKIVNQNEIEKFQFKISKSFKIIGINGFHNSNGDIVGIGVYIYFVDNSNLMYYLFEKDNSKYNLIKGFPGRTIDTDVKDIIYLSTIYFPTSDYSLLRLDTYDELSLDYNKNDLKFHIFNSSIKNNFNYFNSITLIRNENGNTVRMSGEPCSLAVHRCADGTPGSLCNGYYCWAPPTDPRDQTIDEPVGSGDDESCSRKRVGKKIKENIDEENYNEFENNLPLENLYQLKDKVKLTRKGKIFVFMYYYTGENLYEVLDTELLYDLKDISYSVGKAAEKYNNNVNEVIINDSFANKLITLFQKIKLKTSNDEYKDFLDLLIFEVNNLKNLNSNQIDLYLNS